VAIVKTQKNNAQDIDNSQSRLALCSLDKASVACFRHGADGRFTYANRLACESLGYTLDELKGLHVIDIDPSVTAQSWPGLWQKMCDAGSITFESRHRRKDGTVFPVEVNANHLVFENRQFSVSFVQDITERKKIEDALRLTQFAFRKASIGIFYSRSDARIFDANEQACKSLDYSRDELCRMTVFDIDPAISENDWDELWRQTCEKEVFSFETVHRRKDGTTFPVEITANLLDFQGVKYSVTFVRDITQQKGDEEARIEAETHLRQSQKMEALGTLAGGIAHDFNNILSGILGFAQLAQMHCPQGDRMERYINQICAASDRAKDLISQILAFSRQGQAEKTPVSLSRVINEALKLIEASIPSTIEIRRHIGSNLGFVFADEIQIHQVIMNLCTNAYQAMRKNGGVLDISLVPLTLNDHDARNFPDLHPGRYLKLVVADTGCGMQADVLNRIFEPYFTTKKAREGTGMGLSMVHGIVKDHGGSIKVCSESGVGTTFLVLFPVADTDREQVAVSLDSLPTGKERILFVDDEELLIEFGKETLERLGYVVDTRASSIDALEAFRACPQKYDLVISDFTMPKMTGENLAKAIKKRRPDIPIILCSGFSARISPDTITRIGISDVLMKPVTISDLANSVRCVLDS
jgi:two-component system cell cycle sensor histidine kinase/response regulator CckA